MMNSQDSTADQKKNSTSKNHPPQIQASQRGTYVSGLCWLSEEGYAAQLLFPQKWCAIWNLPPCPGYVLGPAPQLAPTKEISANSRKQQFVFNTSWLIMVPIILSSLSKNTHIRTSVCCCVATCILAHTERLAVWNTQWVWILNNDTRVTALLSKRSLEAIKIFLYWL